jgi:transmembrane sensor
MQESENWDLIAKYLSGKTIPSEDIQLEAWIDESEENRKKFDLQKAIWINTSLPAGDFGKEVRWQALKAQIEKEEKRNVFSFSPLFRAAASIALLVSMGIVFLLFLYKNEGIVIIKAPADRHIAVTLPDKSTVWLNKNSEIKYPEDFEEETREVSLKGEAFFEIAKNIKKPFLIAANGTVTKVLGTSFNVRALEEDNEVAVTVVSGKVAFYEEGSPDVQLTLLPGDNGIFNKNKKNLTKSGEVKDNFLAWKTGILVFENAKLQEVFKSLESQYPYEITVTSPRILDCKITSSYQNSPIEKILKELEILMGISYSIQEDKIIISGTGCN